MSLQTELAQLFRRDLTRLQQEVNAFGDDQTLWQRLPGVENSAGNLVLHLEGNLREYIGRQLGGLDYTRQRDAEFSSTGLSREELSLRVAALLETIPAVIAALSEAQLEADYPARVLNVENSTRQFLFHLYGHFSYHLGQIDYLRRILSQGSAVAFVGL
jgi:uncharacterized damage-inducible protein DinB